MKQLLIDTHKEENINILKARDYYFDKARFRNLHIRKWLLIAPILITLFGMIVATFASMLAREGMGIWKVLSSLSAWMDKYLETLVGIVAIIAFILDCFIETQIEKYVGMSNELRELYDCRVLGISPNTFFYSSDEETIKRNMSVSQYVPDDGKYEVWYREIFSDDSFLNAICCMMDNIIYGYYIYRDFAKIRFRNLITIAALMAVYCVSYIFINDGRIVLVTPLLVFVAIFDFVKELVSDYTVSKNLEKSSYDLKTYVKDHADEIKADVDNRRLILRKIEDVVMYQRESALFVPKKVRKKYLSNTCEFYVELDQVKNAYQDKNTESLPTTAEDFEILTNDGTDTSTVTMAQVHKRLLNMLSDVKEVLDKAGISFTLDGGTLIGAVRENNSQIPVYEGGKFLPWDDDVDIALNIKDLNRVREVIASELGEKYIIQDAENEPFYSPRLSNFRIREKNDRSSMAEKDSCLWEKYENKGLFLDVYVYSPILVNMCFDSVFRKIFIHPLHKKIKKVENDWKYIPQKKKRNERLFFKYKSKYLKRVKYYEKHAKCDKYYAYVPFYIEDLKKAGPYIRRESLYGEKKVAEFENSFYEVPTRSEDVLKAFYGEKWYVSPFKSKEELMEECRVEKEKTGKDVYWYSRASFDASKYKHAKRISLF